MFVVSVCGEERRWMGEEREVIIDDLEGCSVGEGSPEHLFDSGK